MLAWTSIIPDELKVCFTYLHIFSIIMLWAMDEVMDLFVFVKFPKRHLLLSICLVCDQYLCYVHSVV